MAENTYACTDGAPLREDLRLDDVVASLCATSDGMARARGDDACRRVLPSRDSVITMVEELRSVLFPGYFGMSELNTESLHYTVGATLDRVLRTLREQVRRGMCFSCDQPEPDCRICDDNAETVVKTILHRLPEVRRLLALDVQAHFEGDPAATCPDEAIFSYPGVQAITNYRIAHELFRLEVPLLPRIITEYAHSITGIDIHPGAEIGERFFIDHGTGVVIGETCVVHAGVKIYQGVTLGAKSLPLDEDGNPIKGIPRHPIVEEGVVIYSGATILGRVTLGRGSIIGGNVWLTRSVPPGSRITQARAREEGFEQGAGI